MNDFDEMPTMNVIHLLALKDNEIFDLQRNVAEMKTALEWGCRIIDSVRYGGIPRYAPDEWFGEYHRINRTLKGNQ